MATVSAVRRVPNVIGMTQEDMQLISNPYVVGAARSADSLNKQVSCGIRKTVLESRIEFEEDNSRDRQWLDSVQGKYIQLTPGRNDRTVANGAGKLAERSSGLTVENGVVKNGISPARSRTSSPQKQGATEDGIPRPSVRLHPAGAVTLEWRKIRRIGVGLLNAGNTCFLNSVLQCLSYCPPLANYLLDEENHIAKCKSRMTFCMMCELQRHVKRALENSTSPIRPAIIVENLRNIAKQFRHGSQEDAHEFLRYVVDHLARSCINMYSGSTPLDRVSKETTVIHEIFGGYHRSQVTCLECKHTSNTYDLFMDFILDIKGAQTLTQALEKSVEPEILSGDNAYECPRCRKKVRAQKRLTVHRAPKVSTIQFKRFDSMGHKVTRQMAYCDKLDLRPYMSDRQGGPLMYRLFGVLVHYGSTCNSGHYLCYVKNSNDNWYLMNDQQVHEVGLQKVLNQENAYLLFYVRQMPKETVVKKSSPLTLSNGPSVEPIRNGHIEPSWKKSLFQKSSSAPSSTPSSPSLTNGSSSNTAPPQHKPTTPLPVNRSKISFGIRQPCDGPTAAATHTTPVKRPAPAVTTPVKRPASGPGEGFTPSKSRLVPYTSNSSDTDDDRKASNTSQQMEGAESPKVKIGVSTWNVSAVKPPAASCQPPAGWNVTNTKESAEPVKSEEVGDSRVPSEPHNGTVENRPFLASPVVERVRQSDGGSPPVPAPSSTARDKEGGSAGAAQGRGALPAPSIAGVSQQGVASHRDEKGGGDRWQERGNLNGEEGPWAEKTKEPKWGHERQGGGDSRFESGVGRSSSEEDAQRARGERFEKYIRDGGTPFGGQPARTGALRGNYTQHRGFHDSRGSGRVSKRPLFHCKSGSQYGNYERLKKMGFLGRNDGYNSRDDGRYGNSGNPFQEAQNFRNNGHRGGRGYGQDSKPHYHKQNFGHHRRGSGHRYHRQMGRSHYSNWPV